MPSRPPYLVRSGDQECEADDLGEAMDSACDMYDPSGPIPEVVDAGGDIVFDPTAIVGEVMRRRDPV